MGGQVKGSCNKYRGFVSHGVASNDCNRTVAIGSRVSVEWSVKYMEHDTMTLGQRIKQIRLERGETLEEFGEHFDTPKATVWNWESERNNPHKKNLKRIAKLGNTTVDELLHGKPTNDDIAMDLIDFYIMHYEKLGKRGLAGAMRELQTDINNALNIGDD